ncbi:hypothetical protein U1Q18_005549 [Sarracenia purpurea var. burkii]
MLFMQLEEFERAVKSSYNKSVDDNAKERHRQFIIAIECHISKIESSLHESAISDGKPPLPWVHLDDRECHELALFLSGPPMHTDKIYAKNHGKDGLLAMPQETDDRSTKESLNYSRHSVEWNLVEAVDEKLPGHRRTASAGPDIGFLKIEVADDVFPQSTSSGRPGPPPRKIPSVSGWLSTMETASKLKWSKNGYRKLKNMDHSQEPDNTLSQSQQVTKYVANAYIPAFSAKGINACSERSKSCLDGSSGCDDCYEKQLYGWYGAIQRLLQRSQYQMQYSRPIQMVLSMVLCLIGRDDAERRKKNRRRKKAHRVGNCEKSTQTIVSIENVVGWCCNLSNSELECNRSRVSIIPMRVLVSDSIESVKLSIWTYKGFVVKNQRLVCGGRELARIGSE